MIEVSPGDLEWDAVTTAQQHAADGLYAQAFSAYVQWLAARLPAIQAGLKAEIRRLRDEATRSGQHKRTPFMVANLAVGLHYFLTFAKEAGAITDAEAENLWQSGLAALGEAATAQQQHIVDEEPTRRYFEFLRAAIASGRAHVANPQGMEPLDPVTWGWNEYYAEHGLTYWKGRGSCIGWVDGKELYLKPEAAHAVAQQQAGAGGDSLGITSKTLHKRLFEKGWLQSREGSRQTYTVRRTLQGARRRVLHLRASALMPQGPDQPAQPDQQPDEDAEDGDSPAGTGAGSWAGQPHAPAQQPAQTTPESPARVTVAPSLGQVGQVGQVVEDIDNRPSNEGEAPRERFDL